MGEQGWGTEINDEQHGVPHMRLETRGGWMLRPMPPAAKLPLLSRSCQRVGRAGKPAMSKGTVAAVCCQCGAIDLVSLGANVVAPSDSTLLLCPKCAPKFLNGWTEHWSALSFEGPWSDRIRRRAEQLNLIEKEEAAP